MQPSTTRVCLSEHVGPLRWTLGNQDRTRDQAGLGDTFLEMDTSKYTDDYKGYTGSKQPEHANDSGFVEPFLTTDTDDISGWRKDFMPAGALLTSPNICSTPIREPTFYFPRFDFTGNYAQVRRSPLHPAHFSPVLPRSSPPSTSGGSLPIGISVFPPRNSNAVKHVTLFDPVDDLLADRTRSSYNDIYTVSDVSRGHRTIASMLKSHPLNIGPLKSPYSENIGRKERLSDLQKLAANNKQIAIPKKSGICPSFAHTDCRLETYSFSKYDNALPKYCKQRLFTETIQYSDISEGEGMAEIDENNNTNDLTAKYSDISDACASDAGSLVESSSWEEEIQAPGLVANTQKIQVAKRGRKSIPRRSASKIDPKFRGVTVWLQTSYQKGSSNLQISAFYSNVTTRPVTRRRTRDKKRWSSQPRWSSSKSWSCSDQEESVPTHYGKDTSIVKTCASCKTRRTPLWRDAEDGTPLCNACGIRYKKYRLRCSKCWHIPKKEVKTYPLCPVCSGPLRYSSHKKVW